MADKSIAEKLQVKGPRRLAVLNAPKAVDSQIGARKARAETKSADVIVLFVRNRTELDDKLPPVLRSLPTTTIFWLAYPKLTSTIAADINRDIIAKLVPQHGLETVAQIAIDEDWSALRLKLSR